MDIKDYSQKLSQVNDSHRKEQNDLRSSYEKRLDDVKDNFGKKLAKQSLNYDVQNEKQAEQSIETNKMFTDKTKKVIQDRQESFRNDLAKNSEKFDADRNEMKTSFGNKLSNLSESYKKITEDNDRFHNQAEKTMGERYAKANEKFSGQFGKEIENLEMKSKQGLALQKEDYLKERADLEKEHNESYEALRSSSQDEKFKEFSRIRSDNDALRTNTELEKANMREQQDNRIADILKAKNAESIDNQNNFTNLQENLVKKNLADDERVKLNHQNESKALEKNFNEDIKNIQHLSDRKAKVENAVASLKDENKHIITSSDNRIKGLLADVKKERENSIQKENTINANNQEKLKELKFSLAEQADANEAILTSQHKDKLQDIKEKNNALISRYKTEVGTTKSEGEEKLSNANQISKTQFEKQRVEFGKFINMVNEKKMEEISSIKSEEEKDKTMIAEKFKRDLNSERMSLKADFSNKSNIKDDMYEKKLSEIEKHTNKIIDDYENKMFQVSHKAQSDMDNLKKTNEINRMKENQSIQNEVDAMEAQHQADINNMRDKYENMLNKVHAVNDQQTNRIFHKFEDQINQERAASQRELSAKLGESESKFDRFYKSSELEKESMRAQFEQRIENMRQANLKSDGNTKKA